MLLHSPLPPTVWQCTEGAPLLTTGWCAVVCWVALCCPLPPLQHNIVQKDPHRPLLRALHQRTKGSPIDAFTLQRNVVQKDP